MTLVVDASVALKWFVESAHSEAAVKLLERDEELIAPDLVVAEVANAAWKLARAGHIEGEHGRQIVDSIAQAFSRLISSEELASRAYDLAARLEHPVYDCLYLALTVKERARLVTADRRLQRRLEQSPWKERLYPLSSSR